MYFYKIIKITLKAIFLSWLVVKTIVQNYIQDSKIKKNIWNKNTQFKVVMVKKKDFEIQFFLHV